MRSPASHLAPSSHAAGILDALARLDERLRVAAAAVRGATGVGPGDDPFRGLYVGDRDVERLLADGPGRPDDAVRSAATPARHEHGGLGGRLPRADWLAASFDLSPFDLDLLLIALAPEVDLGYERIYAYLQDDVTRKRPTADLALGLLCGDAEEKLARRRHLLPGSPLVGNELVHLDADPGQPNAPLLARALRPDEQVVALLLGHGGVDARLAGFATLVGPPAAGAEPALEAPTRRALAALLDRAAAAGEPLRLLFLGRVGSGRRAAAAALAAGTGRQLLCVDLQAARSGAGDDRLFERVLRQASFLDAVPYLEGVDTIAAPATERALAEAMERGRGLVVLAAERDWQPLRRPWTGEALGLVRVRFPAPAMAERGWAQALAAGGVVDGPRLAGVLARRLRSTRAQMAETVAEAVAARRWAQARDGSGDGGPGGRVVLTEDELLGAAQSTEGGALAGLATRIDPVHTWDDLVLPAPVRAQLEELCDRVVHRGRVMSDWGFEGKLSLGRGVNALFAGPSGTGKTMAAGVIARATGLVLYRIDLSGVVSKYIGETEKNLDRIFAAAEGMNAILCFDEADALFGKRSEVRDAHDRYANIEISYLLQKMDSFEGLAILATNLRQNLDAAFTRRVAFQVAFPMPDAQDRRRIWRRVWPDRAPLAGDADLDAIAHRFKLSGGNIRNIALAAAFLGAADGGTIGNHHILRALRREYQKMGKTVTDAELLGLLPGGGPGPAT